MHSVVFRLSGDSMYTYRVILQSDGLYRIDKKDGLFSRWKEVHIPVKTSRTVFEQVVSYAKWLHACDVERKKQRDRVVMKL